MTSTRNTVSPARRLSVARGAALAMAVLTLTTQLGGILHWVAVQHVTCPEHGEWMHTDGLPSPHPTLVAVELHAATETPTVQGDAHTELGHGHDHCSSILPRRDETWAPTTSFTSALLAPPLVLTAPGDDALHPAPVSILSVAPKASPPRA